MKVHSLGHVDREVGNADVVVAAVLLDGEAVAGETVGQDWNQRPPLSAASATTEADAGRGSVPG